jgi:hypothetical protein
MDSLDNELTIKLEEYDEQMKKELIQIKEKYNTLKKNLRIEYSKKKKQINPEKISQPRKSIPKIVKNQVWDNYIGKDKGIGKCYCCNNDIDSKHFECGHINSVASGGTDTCDNLRPICSLCNKSIGIQNMDEFKKQYLDSKKPEENKPSWYIPKKPVENKPSWYKLQNREPFDFLNQYNSNILNYQQFGMNHN